MRPRPRRVITAFAKHDVPENVAVPDTPKSPVGIRRIRHHYVQPRGYRAHHPAPDTRQIDLPAVDRPGGTGATTARDGVGALAASPLTDSVTLILTTWPWLGRDSSSIVFPDRVPLKRTRFTIPVEAPSEWLQHGAHRPRGGVERPLEGDERRVGPVRWIDDQPPWV